MGQSERSPQEIKRYIGFPLQQMFREFTSAPVDQLYRHFQVRAADTVVQSARVLEGVDDVLAELSERGYRMSIVTTKTRSHLDGIVTKLGWEPYFAQNISGSDVATPKPNPEAFALALERLGCAADSALVIGDTINDVLAARAIPMKVASVRSPYGGHDKVAALKPDYELNHLRDLLPLLSNHEK
jgi:HAD superfamily hydrolase (TIGR01509 family)